MLPKSLKCPSGMPVHIRKGLAMDPLNRLFSLPWHGEKYFVHAHTFLVYLFRMNHWSLRDENTPGLCLQSDSFAAHSAQGAGRVERESMATLRVEMEILLVLTSNIHFPYCYRKGTLQASFNEIQCSILCKMLKFFPVQLRELKGPPS